MRINKSVGEFQSKYQPSNPSIKHSYFTQYPKPQIEQYHPEPKINRQQIQQTQKQQIQPDIANSQRQRPQKSIFDQYLQILKSKIFKRKIILFILNILLTLAAFIFALIFIIWEASSNKNDTQIKIQQIFNTEFSYLTLAFIVFIGSLSAVFSIIIIKGKVIMLHCYWVSCLLFLIIFSIIGASAYSLTSMKCQQPSSYILQKIKVTSQSASNLFCSNMCPCDYNKSLSNGSNPSFGKVQDCPGWNEEIYSQFLSSVEQNLKCSGWCQINKKSYFTFYQGTQLPLEQQKISCFNQIIHQIQSSTIYLRICSIVLCSLLMIVILYTNYYIFMQKQDDNRQTKKMKKRINQAQQRMQQELRTSKRMLQ